MRIAEKGASKPWWRTNGCFLERAAYTYPVPVKGSASLLRFSFLLFLFMEPFSLSLSLAFPVHRKPYRSLVCR